MLKPVDNKTAYSTTDFACWAYAEKLLPEELYLIENFLKKDASTLEAGTGGGRILYSMHEMGFTNLSGYDYISAFIDEARIRCADTPIQLEVQDATSLTYDTASLDQVIYLGQVTCFIESDAGRKAVLKEAQRILKPGGTAIFSFLSFDIRNSGFAYRLYIAYTRLLRLLTGSKRPIQHLSRLKVGEKINLRSLLDNGPHAYWYRHADICCDLQEAGFVVKAVGSSHQLGQKRTCDSFESLGKEPVTGMLYVVCTK